MSEQSAAQLTTLPPVAKSIFIFCKKCNVDRYQTVLAHTSATAAKVQCEVCKAKSSWKLAKSKAMKPLAGAALKRKSTSVTARKNAHINAFNDLAATVKGDPQSYNMRMKFSAHQQLQHPKFGVGYIRSVLVDKIEVVFEDEVRMLVHNRP